MGVAFYVLILLTFNVPLRHSYFLIYDLVYSHLHNEFVIQLRDPGISLYHN